LTLGELLHWIDHSGSLVVVKDGKPLLRLPAGASPPGNEVKAALRENRDYFLSLGPGGDEAGSLPMLDWPYWCVVCERQIHCADPAVVWQVCGNVGCPFWIPRFGPAWMDSARWWWDKRRAEKRAAERDQHISE
jgi:hypothetical protein